MARSKSNIVIEGLSGKIGNLVFRRRKKDGKVFVSAAPSPHKVAPTEAKKKVNDRFQQAVMYGKSVVANPDLKSLYAQKTSGGQTAFNVAVADYLNAPTIEEIDLSNYTGQVGSVIRVKATDNFKVARVLVTIKGANGVLLESDEAVEDIENEFYWTYTATEQNSLPGGTRVTVIASDLPQNKTTLEKVL
ncbi:hypothetical protein Palpr_2509 [Paludibacter propionicigenes WB4]|uniref:Uncharacterized protein n=1 Tax=Paludibacter propionicigenes (strain DSM 17365 / JCM 13257 / WB4) TaxID=694427 RepID=E4T7E7_PALPW|nr:hypothetical protein [Paludibacter propionicigenes]ADQ80641.1 hypothetical protein Palpr_2509 [Paludibacter propionicigenes WB4]